MCVIYSVLLVIILVLCKISMYWANSNFCYTNNIMLTKSFALGNLLYQIGYQ